jgi:hypothetical protein
MGIRRFIASRSKSHHPLEPSAALGFIAMLVMDFYTNPKKEKKKKKKKKRGKREEKEGGKRGRKREGNSELKLSYSSEIYFTFPLISKY